MRLPARLVPVVGVVAASSLWIYLLHWRVYPWLEVECRCWRPLLSLAVGVLAASVVRRVGLPSPAVGRRARESLTR